jgi:serine/threonine-protein kinase
MPERRYPSAEALADDLGRWLRGEPTLARAPRWPAHLLRRVRRWAAAACIGLALAAGATVLYLNSPQHAIRQIEAELARGHSVMLIPETGRPRWYRVPFGESRTQTSLAPDGSFSVHSWSLCLLELLRDPQHDSYRFTAQVRHEKSDLHGGVGVYFAHGAHPRTQAEVQLFTQMTYNDLHSNAELARLAPQPLKLVISKFNLVMLYSHLCFEDHQGLVWETSIDSEARSSFTPAGLGAPWGESGAPWRQLEVIVTPESVRGFFDGKPLGSLPIATIGSQMGDQLVRTRELNPNDPVVLDMSPDFRVRGALGLYIHRGSASFRAVVVEPLAGPK